MSNATPLVGDDVLMQRLELSLAYTEAERVATLARTVTDYGTGLLTPYQSLVDLANAAQTADPGVVVRPEVASRWAGAVLAVIDGAMAADDLADLRARLAQAAGVAS